MVCRVAAWTMFSPTVHTISKFEKSAQIPMRTVILNTLQVRARLWLCEQKLLNPFLSLKCIHIVFWQSGRAPTQRRVFSGIGKFKSFQEMTQIGQTRNSRKPPQPLVLQ
jgi:hypothetical protein